MRGLPGETEPPCETCRVDLMAENADAGMIFHLVRYQLILGPSSAFDIRHDAIWRMIDELKIKNRLKCFNKICALANQWWIPKLNEKSEG